MKTKKIAQATLIALVSTTSTASLAANSEVEALRAEMERLMERIEQLESQNTPRQEKVADGESKSRVTPLNEGERMRIYGGVHVSVDHNSKNFGDGVRGTSFKSNASRLGVRGSMPTTLGDTHLLYRAEMRYGATDQVKNEIEWRVAFAGLRGGWGTVRAGRLTTQYKSSYVGIDPWTDNAPQARQNGGRQGTSALHASYFNKAIQYNTPNFNGLSGSLWYARQFDDGNADMHNAGILSPFKGGQVGGVGIRYDKGNTLLFADTLNIDADNVERDDLSNGTTWQLGGRYKFGDLSFAAMYEDAKKVGLGQSFYANGIYRIGKTRLIAAYGHNRAADRFNNDKIDTWSIGAKYDLTDHSELLAAFVTRDEGGKRLNTFTLGVNAKFGVNIR